MNSRLSRPRSPGPARHHRQGGAVLYVALIMLVLLALIGIIGMQVSGMQERMAANYRAANLAFQHAEEHARGTECGLEVMNGITRPGCTAVNRADVGTQCDDGFDAGVWAADRELADAPARSVRQIESCIIGEAEIAMGLTQEQGGGLLPIYQITVYQADDDSVLGASRTSAVAIDTIFKL